jgi:hypothetical protein
MTGTNCDLFTHKSSWSYSNHLVFWWMFQRSLSCPCLGWHCFVLKMEERGFSEIVSTKSTNGHFPEDGIFKHRIAA